MGNGPSSRRLPPHSGRRRQRRQRQNESIQRVYEVLRHPQTPQFRAGSVMCLPNDVVRAELILNPRYRGAEYCARSVSFYRGQRDMPPAIDIPHEAAGHGYGYQFALIRYWLEQWRVPLDATGWFQLRGLDAEQRGCVLDLYRRALEARH